MAKILVVDDNLANREFLVTLLGYSGHHLLAAGDGAEGLRLARAERPDLIITDLLMPVLDGFEMVRDLRADPALAQTPVIFYTATYHEKEVEALARTAGVSLMLTKPSDPETILNVVQAALGYAQPPALPPSPLTEEFDREHLRIVTDKLVAKVAQLEAANARLAALIEVGQQLGVERDPLRLLQKFCHAAREIIFARYAALAILDDEGRALRLFFTSGLDQEAVAHIGAPPTLEGLLGRVLREGRSLRLRDAGADPSAIGLPAHHPAIRSFLGAPLASAGKVYGLLYLGEKLGLDEFTEEDEHVVLALAAQVAVAYENARLYDEVRRHAAELEQEVAERKQVEAALRAKSEEVASVTQQLWQAARLATMGELAAGVAHELNNPLAIVSLRTESLLQGTPDGDPRQRELEIIAQEVERMTNLVSNLLQSSRSKPEKSSLDVRDEIEKTLELIHYHLRKCQITVVREFAPDVPLVLADRQQLRQVLLNLFTNASDAMPQGGTLTVRVQAQPPDQVVIEVADTGEGIPPGLLPKVWDAFFTTKPEGKGTGLGLPICRRIVQEHGGTIDITSPGVDNGATVRLTLPGAAGSRRPSLDEA